MQRHWFPGGNTARGFYSFYQHILTPEDAHRFIILKGGPGVGKSTFMRKMGALLEDHSQAVEYLHCSSDPDSLDGIVCRELGFAMVDGTRPHIVDPKLPGAADSILNLGVFLDEGALAEKKEEISSLTGAISTCFTRAYRYLASALPLRDDSVAILRLLTDEKALMKEFSPWLETITSYRSPTKPGQSRSIFASAITPEGCVHYLETLAVPRIWRIAGVWGSDSHRILSILWYAALMRGLNVEAMYCPLQPDRLEHIFIPAFGLFITTENKYHSLTYQAERTICFDEFMIKPTSALEKNALQFNGEQFELFLQTACVSLRKAKDLHDELEAEYIPNMDFDKVEACFLETSRKVLDLLEKKCLLSMAE